MNQVQDHAGNIPKERFRSVGFIRSEEGSVVQVAVGADTDGEQATWGAIPLECKLAVRFRANRWGCYPQGQCPEELGGQSVCFSADWRGAIAIRSATDGAPAQLVLATRIPGAELLAIDGGDHVAIFTHRAQVRAQVTQFLRQHTPTAPGSCGG
jgi:hypothetical protein